MLQLKNSTPFASNMTIFPNELGVDTLYIITKATFNIGTQWTLVEEQPPIQEEDVYWTEPVKSSLKYASDIHVGKPATDIIMLGHAITPNEKQVTELDVNLFVGNNKKTIRVIGDREWKDSKITSPKPFKTMPMVYEKAYGGVHVVDGKIHSAEMRNPLGCGFVGLRKANEMNKVPLPNLEDPQNLISYFDDQPISACFGYVGPSWQPRSNYVGTYDDDWQQNCAPYLPKDFDKRFLNMAHPDMIVKGYLHGGELVHISNMNQTGNLDFNLPTVNLVSNIKIENHVERAEFSMETLLLEPNKSQLSMVWRASMQCDKKALKIHEVNISVSR